MQSRVELLVQTYQFLTKLPGFTTYVNSAEKYKQRDQNVLFHLWLISHALLLCQSLKVCVKAINPKNNLARDLCAELGLAALTGITLFKMEKQKHHETIKPEITSRDHRL